MNTDLIPINDSLKEIPFLYIENSVSLDENDRSIMEAALGGFGSFADLEEYNIEYLFDASFNPDLTDKIDSAEFILLSTGFIDTSYHMLQNLVAYALKHGLKDKVIINCMKLKPRTFEGDLLEKIKELDEKQNIGFYFPSKNLNAFVRFNNKQGFE